MAPISTVGAGGLRDREGLGLAAMAPRVIAVALVFWLARLAAGAAVTALAGAVPPDPVAELAAGAVIGATLGWLVPRLRGAARSSVFVVTVVLGVNVLAVMIEGAAFAPATSPVSQLPLQLVVQMGVSVAVAAVAVALLAGTDSEPGLALARRSPGWWASRLGATTMVYVVAYFVTGAINYVLVTGPYYETHSGGLATPQIGVVVVVALLEGLIISAGMVPLARRLGGGTRLARALAVGLVLFVLGGLVPLLQVTSLPDVIRAASAVEILFQKVPLGVAVAILFGMEDR